MLKYKVHRFVGLLILVYILLKVDWSQMSGTISQANSLCLIIALLISIPQIGFKCIRWKMLLSTQGHIITTVNAFLFYCSSIYLGVITPGRLGEFAKALYLRQAGIANLSRAFSSVLVDRLCDLYLLFFLGMLGLVYLTPWPKAEIFGWGGIVCAIVFLLSFLNSDRMGKVVSLFCKKALSSRMPELAKCEAKQFWNGLQELLGWRLGLAGLLTVISYALFFLQCFLISQALSLPISYLEIIPIMAMTNLFTFLPITISGLGTREAALLFFLTPKGISLELILAFSLGVLIVFFVGGGILGAWAWWMRPLDFQQKQR